MNKKNKILVGCLALLLTLSAGYALFSDTITINGTATAKGSFDITATCESGISSKLGTAESLGLSKEGGYENDTCTATDDVVSANVNFKYPGARRYFTVKLKNTGTITATIDQDDMVKNGEFCYSPGSNLESDFYNCYSLGKNGQMGVQTNINEGGYSGWAKEYFYAMSDENDNILSQEQASNYYDTENNVITLLPGYSGYLVLEYGVNSDHFSGVMNLKVNATLEIPFKQAQ